MVEKEKLRLFLGSFIDIEPVSAEFDYPIRFVNKENLHLTWKFFGDTEHSQVPKLLSQIEKTISKLDEIAINFNRFELWPNAKFPRLLVLAGDDINGSATELYRAFNKGKFNPHITVARFRLKQKLETPLNIPESLVFKEKQFDFKEISLLHSKLTSKGSIYEAVKTFDL